MINLVKTEHNLADVVEVVQKNLKDALHERDQAAEHLSLVLDDLEAARHDVDDLAEQIAVVEHLVSDPQWDLASHPGVLEIARKALAKAEKCLQSESYSHNRAQDRLHAAEAELKLRKEEHKLILMAEAELAS